MRGSPGGGGAVTSRAPNVYRALMENLLDGVMVIGFDGSVKLANAAACRMLGLRPEEVVGRRFGEVFIQFEGFDEFTQMVLDAVQNRSGVERRVASVRIGDAVRSLSVTTSYLSAAREGGTAPMAVIAALADITEVRELRETALRRAKVIERQLGELQGAYRDIEARNAALSRMTKKVQVARVAATLFVVALFVAIGAWHVRPLDLFREAVAPPALAGIDAGEPAALHTMSVEPGVLRATLSLRGHLAPGRVVKVVSPVESHVSGVHVRYGQRVSEGVLLVDLETGQLAAEHRSAQVDHIRALEALEALEDWDNGTEMTGARRGLRRAKMALDNEERQLRRATFLLEQGLIPASEHEEARERRESRTLDFEEARRELEAAKAKGGGDARKVAQLEAENTRARLEEHERKLALAEVRAPIAGVVVAAERTGDKPLARGRPVAQGELLVSIADFERISVLTNVDEVDVGKIEAGQRAWITGPGFPDLRLEGTVTHVSSRAGGGSRGQSTPRFEIVVALERLDASGRDRLRVGMSAHVTIVVHDRPGALLVPIEAVEQRDGATWVRVIDRGTEGEGAAVEERAVELGLTTLDSVEVVEGLEAGEEIVLSRS